MGDKCHVMQMPSGNIKYITTLDASKEKSVSNQSRLITNLVSQVVRYKTAQERDIARLPNGSGQGNCESNHSASSGNDHVVTETTNASNSNSAVNPNKTSAGNCHVPVNKARPIISVQRAPGGSPAITFTNLNQRAISNSDANKANSPIRQFVVKTPSHFLTKSNGITLLRQADPQNFKTVAATDQSKSESNKVAPNMVTFRIQNASENGNDNSQQNRHIYRQFKGIPVTTSFQPQIVQAKKVFAPDTSEVYRGKSPLIYKNIHPVDEDKRSK